MYDPTLDLGFNVDGFASVYANLCFLYVEDLFKFTNLSLSIFVLKPDINPCNAVFI